MAKNGHVDVISSVDIEKVVEQYLPDQNFRVIETKTRSNPTCVACDALVCRGVETGKPCISPGERTL